MSDPDGTTEQPPPAPVVPLRPGYGTPAPGNGPAGRSGNGGTQALRDTGGTAAPSRGRSGARTQADGVGAGNGGGGNGNGRPRRREPGEPRRRVRIRKLRVLAILTGLGLLAAVSTVFGMMMAVASDLP
jgi:hypothetical protein